MHVRDDLVCSLGAWKSAQRFFLKKVRAVLPRMAQFFLYALHVLRRSLNEADTLHTRG
jgi:hypothetical protein